MITYRCDGCGREMAKNDLRYQVKIDVRAAFDEVTVSLMDLVRDHRSEMLALIERLKNKEPDEIEETVYKGYTFDLCPRCHRAYTHDPLRFHPEQGKDDSGVDIDSFLRSLGYGKEAGPEADG
jgi:hypothetical protein